MEVVYGRKVTVEDVNEYQTIKRFEELENRIDPNVRKQMLLEPLFMLLETTYECLKEEPKRRPCMYEIGERLKKAFNIQWKHENIILTGRLDYPAYMMEIVNGFASAVDLKKMTDPMIKEEAQYSLDTFTEIIYRCLTGTPSERPTFEVVIMSLEKALDFQTQLHVKNFESLEIPLSHIKLATDNFSDAYRLKPHEYDMVYEAELHHIYRGSVLTREGKNKDELPKKKVIIIRIFDFKKITKDFFAEIEMLSRCTNMYLDPEYARTGRLKKASDIYSFGVVLFEIFSGKLAYDSCYIKENEKGLAAIARKHFKKGTLKEILDPRVMDKAYELGFTGKVEPNYDSLDVFSRIAYLCVAKLQDERPTIEVVTEELEKALYFQENRIKTLKVSLDHIRLVEELLVDNYNMRGEHGMLYKGEVPHKNSHKKVVVKRFSPHKLSSEREFLKEFEVLFKYKHENIIGLLGYCEEMGEKIIVYEHASKGTLDKYVNDTNFSWTKRLKVCIDIANGLKFLHDGGDLGHDVVIHRDIKSSNILLNKDWKAKICGFDHSLIYPPNERFEYVKDNVGSSPGYCDPSFLKTQFLTKESDIYSFGVILFEILCGRLARPDFKDHSQLLDVLYKRQEAPFLDVLVKRHIQEAPLEEIVFKGIKEQIGLNSLDTFGRIAFQCLLDERKERPTSGDVVVQLQKALKFQESYETHEARSHRNVKRKLCKSSEIYSTMAKKDILSILSKNILLQNDKLEIIRVLRQTSLDLEEEDDGIGYGDCDANDYQEDTLKKENTRNVLEN
ncbi:hypothetical protein QVD17_38702 [Tagetes erecta]|uniref:Protein kinase domain-containing protein n=1 Tax=Tagetes erecta TaxID=13708 RepID=A0AAD8JNY1_TARER|nr:hypothetical protein QVD17_38702 [Tagetes erecta]